MSEVSIPSWLKAFSLQDPLSEWNLLIIVLAIYLCNLPVILKKAEFETVVGFPITGASYRA
jgi:hypothetical protein